MKQILSSLGLMTQGDESAWAVTSPDDQFRYILGRTWDPYFQEQQGLLSEPVRPLWVFGMLNPSKARGAGVDDPTIRKCTGFAKRGHAGGFLVVNMLGRHIAAWGKIPPSLRSVAQPSVVQFLCSRPECFGLNGDRSPKHPLMLGYDTAIMKISEARS